MNQIQIPAQYLVTDNGTSDGTQEKYYYQNRWYKVDRYGGEGAVEELSSQILTLSHMPQDKFVSYEQIIINDQPGCVSQNFLHENESFITFYRLFSNIRGGDLAAVTSRMDYDDAIDFVLSFMNDVTMLDLREYLANTLALDALILNEDRHFNNLGVIYDGDSYKEAPIFDNGKSLFVGNKMYDKNKTIAENKKHTFAKAFSGSFDLNASYLYEYQTIRFDLEMITEKLSLPTDGDFPSARLKRLIRNE